MASINVATNFFSHPKTRRLRARLGPGAVEALISLWCFAAEFHVSSGFLAESPEELAAIVDWRGDAAALISGFVAVGFLDEVDGGLKVHDWEVHARHLVSYTERSRKMNSARWPSYRDSMTDPTGTPTGIHQGLLTGSIKDPPRTPTRTPYRRHQGLPRQGKARQGKEEGGDAGGRTPRTPRSFAFPGARPG